jgi:PPOX class probable F420-dependent enzyme
MLKPPRPLQADEIEKLLTRDVPAHLATLDSDGFPHVTPLWFVWADSAFYMTSIADRPHLHRLQRDPRAGVCVDVEDPQSADWQRPTRQVRATGTAELFADIAAVWTIRITQKYVRGPAAAEQVRARQANDRTVIRVRPYRLVAVASV